MSEVRDPSSGCNCDEAVLSHLHWTADVDFTSQVLHCSARLSGETLKDTKQLVLDICNLTISSVVDTVTGQDLKFETASPLGGGFGSVLKIDLPEACSKAGSKFSVTISYKTSPSCSALEWLTPAQTAGKEQPYLYTQCQAIHARSMLPCMDTPRVKTKYTAEVTAPTNLTALMSAERKGVETCPDSPGKTVTRFEQTVPIPSYLMALVVGALESRRIGPRSKVWCEKEFIDQAEWEFSETDKVLKTAEDIAGQYLWGVYDVLVLPPSFPYGGMENPCLTFVSPTVLSATIEGGDKSAATRIVAHEVSHSWTGNLVTNSSWEHFWLNEGWTTFLERKIIARLYGERERHLRAIGGFQGLGECIEHFRSLDQLFLTAMVPKLTGVHPDDAFSRIPYEKGSLFLFYLETLLGGPGSMDAFIKEYLDTYKFATMDSGRWKQYFLEYFKKEASDGVFDCVEWDKWFYGQGMPPYTPQFDTTLADASAALAERWASITEANEETLAQFAPSDLELSGPTQEEFLNKLLLKGPLPVAVLEAMDSIYGMSAKQDSEVKFRWLQLCLRAGMERVFPLVVDFVTRQGRMKFVRPLYRSLYGCGEKGKQLALSTFAAHRSFYHSTAASQLEKDLQLRPA